jgi:sugar O-acyltransferase (sialic acid O-acetyltransferase NeuD family)
MMSSKRLIIVGAGDLGREILYSSLDDARDGEEPYWIPIAFVDDDPQKCGTTLENLPVLPVDGAHAKSEDNTHFILGVGNPEARETLLAQLVQLAANVRFGSVVHKSATILPNVTVDDGVFVAPNSTIAIGTHLKRHAVVNQNCSVGHDSVVGEFAVLSPGCILSGNTTIGAASFLGSGAITYPGVTLGERCVLSAGTVASRDLRNGSRQILKPNTMLLPG